MRRQRRTGNLIAGVAILVAACTGATASSAPSAAPSSAPSAPASGASSAPASGAPPSGAPAGGTIVIGAILPLTGDGSAYGAGMETAIQIGVDEINAAGGVNGQQLALNVEDDGTNADQGVRAANKLISVNKVNAIIGTWASSVTLAVAPLTVQANIIEMNVSGSPKLSGFDPRVFRANATDAALADSVATKMYADGFKSLTILTNNQAGTTGFGEGIRDSFTKAGGQVLGYTPYADKQQSYASEVNKAVATKPDLFFLSCYTSDGTLILKSAFEAGVTTKWVLPAWCLNTQLSEATGNDVVEGDMAVDLVPVTDATSYTRLNTAYKAKAGKDVFDNVYAVHVYDSILLLALAMQKAGSVDGTAVATAMTDISNAPGTKVGSFADGLAALKAGQDIDYDGASGPIDFNAQNDMKPNVGIFRFKDGKPVLTDSFKGS
jgi:branched-chain amino acid transport system substrate-binding protein